MTGRVRTSPPSYVEQKAKAMGLTVSCTTSSERRRNGSLDLRCVIRNRNKKVIASADGGLAAINWLEGYRAGIKAGRSSAK